MGAVVGQVQSIVSLSISLSSVLNRVRHTITLASVFLSFTLACGTLMTQWSGTASLFPVRQFLVVLPSSNGSHQKREMRFQDGVPQPIPSKVPRS